MRLRHLALVVAVSLAVALKGTEADHPDAIDVLLERQRESLRLPGLSLAIVADGRVVKTAGYGSARLEPHQAATPRTVFEIGSLTKQFTAAAILLLAEDGKLRLEDSVVIHFPRAPESWAPITLRHLLTHTAGIQNHVAVPGFMTLFETVTDRDALLARFFELPLEFRPGETWAYDNTGYYLLGLVIEQVSGVSYWEFLEQRIFRPLGMRSTGPVSREREVDRAHGYGLNGDRFEARPPLTPFMALSAGALSSTIEDMARWAAALDSRALLGPASYEAMWTAAALTSGEVAPADYGFGWFVDQWRSHRFVAHAGGTPGFSSSIYHFPDDRVTVILLCNHGDRILDSLALEIAASYHTGLARKMAFRDPEPARSQALREWFAAALRGEIDASRASPPFARYLETATGQAWFAWYASHGALGKFEFWESPRSATGSRLQYRVELGGNRYWFTFQLTSDGHIAQVNPW